MTAVMLCLLSSVIHAKQQPSTPSRAATASEAKQSGDTKQSPAAKRGFILRVRKEGPLRMFKLSAKDAKVGDIALELSHKLEIPVKVSREVSEQKVSVDINGLNLETTLRFLAAQQFVDYVASGGDMGYAKPLAIYLSGYNENPPPLNETVKGRSQALLVEGDTEEGTEEYEKSRKEEPLKISFINNKLSVRAEKQPLSAVLSHIATEVGVPFEFAGDSNEVVSMTFKDYTVDQAIRALSPSALFYYRANLVNNEISPIRIVLASPAHDPTARGDKN